MKHVFFIISSIFIFSFSVFSQLSPGGLNAGFGVDGDLKAGYLKKGPVTGSVASDDWFSPSTAAGNSILDTTDAATYRSLLQSNKNISFRKGMSVPLNSVVGGNMWLEASYSRDYVLQLTPGVDTSYDSTTFITAANADDLANWTIGKNSTLPPKNDFCDVFFHMRRTGNTVTDSLWVFAALSSIDAMGDRHYDVELYKSPVTFDAASNAFVSGGPNMGHTPWTFDAAGNVTQTGDMILAVSYTSSGVASVQVRIWIAKSTFTTVNPARFNFSNFAARTPVSLYGYASVVANNGSAAFGSGVGNYSSTTANDTTYATPWGSRSTPLGSPSEWSSQYRSQQFFEVGVNLTRIGIDPSLYTALGTAECGPMFSSVLFKSRAANAFTANLEDFVGPLSLSVATTADFTATGDTLRCNQPTGNLLINNGSTAGYYNWRTTTGTISGSNSDSTNLSVTRTGNYIVEAAVAKGCPITRRDTIRVVADSSMPVATASVGSNASAQTQLFGGDPVASNYATPYGGSQGLTWTWTGPNSFTSTMQDPIIGSSDTGVYYLTVTEQRNGCTSAASVYYNFVVLGSNNISLAASASGNNVLLNWKISRAESAAHYVIEKSYNGGAFKAIAMVSAGNERAFSYTDADGSYMEKSYRIKMIHAEGTVYYSNTVNVTGAKRETNRFSLIQTQQETRLVIESTSEKQEQGVIAIYGLGGELLGRQPIRVSQGKNIITVANHGIKGSGLKAITVYIGNTAAFAKSVSGF